MCLKFHGSIFEDFITHTRIDRYNIMCSLVAYDKIQPDYEYDESSIGDRSIPKNATTKSLKALGATLNFIDICLRIFVDDNDARCVVCINDMKYMFKKIPQTMSKALNSKQKVWKVMTYIGSGWYMEKIAKGLPPLNISKISKKAQEKYDEIQKNYMKQISDGIIVNSN